MIKARKSPALRCPAHFLSRGSPESLAAICRRIGLHQTVQNLDTQVFFLSRGKEMAVPVPTG